MPLDQDQKSNGLPPINSSNLNKLKPLLGPGHVQRLRLNNSSSKDRKPLKSPARLAQPSPISNKYQLQSYSQKQFGKNRLIGLQQSDLKADDGLNLQSSSANGEQGLYGFQSKKLQEELLKMQRAQKNQQEEKKEVLNHITFDRELVAKMRKSFHQGEIAEQMQLDPLIKHFEISSQQSLPNQAFKSKDQLYRQEFHDKAKLMSMNNLSMTEYNLSSSFRKTSADRFRQSTLSQHKTSFSNTKMDMPKPAPRNTMITTGDQYLRLSISQKLDQRIQQEPFPFLKKRSNNLSSSSKNNQSLRASQSPMSKRSQENISVNPYDHTLYQSVQGTLHQSQTPAAPKRKFQQPPSHSEILLKSINSEQAAQRGLVTLHPKLLEDKYDFEEDYFNIKKPERLKVSQIPDSIDPLLQTQIQFKEEDLTQRLIESLQTNQVTYNKFRHLNEDGSQAKTMDQLRTNRLKLSKSQELELIELSRMQKNRSQEPMTESMNLELYLSTQELEQLRMQQSFERRDFEAVESYQPESNQIKLATNQLEIIRKNQHGELFKDYTQAAPDSENLPQLKDLFQRPIQDKKKQEIQERQRKKLLEQQRQRARLHPISKQTSAGIGLEGEKLKSAKKSVRSSRAEAREIMVQENKNRVLKDKVKGMEQRIQRRAEELQSQDKSMRMTASTALNRSRYRTPMKKIDDDFNNAFYYEKQILQLQSQILAYRDALSFLEEDQTESKYQKRLGEIEDKIKEQEEQRLLNQKQMQKNAADLLRIEGDGTLSREEKMSSLTKKLDIFRRREKEYELLIEKTVTLEHNLEKMELQSKENQIRLEEKKNTAEYYVDLAKTFTPHIDPVKEINTRKKRAKFVSEAYIRELAQKIKITSEKGNIVLERKVRELIKRKLDLQNDKMQAEKTLQISTVRLQEQKNLIFELESKLPYAFSEALRGRSQEYKINVQDQRNKYDPDDNLVDSVDFSKNLQELLGESPRLNLPHSPIHQNRSSFDPKFSLMNTIPVSPQKQGQEDFGLPLKIKPMFKQSNLTPYSANQLELGYDGFGSRKTPELSYYNALKDPEKKRQKSGSKSGSRRGTPKSSKSKTASPQMRPPSRQIVSRKPLMNEELLDLNHNTGSIKENFFNLGTIQTRQVTSFPSLPIYENTRGGNHSKQNSGQSPINAPSVQQTISANVSGRVKLQAHQVFTPQTKQSRSNSPLDINVSASIKDQARQSKSPLSKISQLSKFNAAKGVDFGDMIENKFADRVEYSYDPVNDYLSGLKAKNERERVEQKKDMIIRQQDRGMIIQSPEEEDDLLSLYQILNSQSKKPSTDGIQSIQPNQISQQPESDAVRKDQNFRNQAEQSYFSKQRHEGDLGEKEPSKIDSVPQFTQMNGQRERIVNPMPVQHRYANSDNQTLSGVSRRQQSQIQNPFHREQSIQEGFVGGQIIRTLEGQSSRPWNTRQEDKLNRRLIEEEEERKIRNYKINQIYFKNSPQITTQNDNKNANSSNPAPSSYIQAEKRNQSTISIPLNSQQTVQSRENNANQQRNPPSSQLQSQQVSQQPNVSDSNGNHNFQSISQSHNQPPHNHMQQYESLHPMTDQEQKLFDKMKTHKFKFQDEQRQHAMQTPISQAFDQSNRQNQERRIPMSFNDFNHSHTQTNNQYGSQPPGNSYFQNEQPHKFKTQNNTHNNNNFRSPRQDNFSQQQTHGGIGMEQFDIAGGLWGLEYMSMGRLINMAEMTMNFNFRRTTK